MPTVRPRLLLLAFLVLAARAPAEEVSAAARERLDAVRRSVRPMNRELAGQRSTASTLALFGATRKEFADWQELVRGTALEPTAEAVMRYVEDTGAALRDGRREEAEFLLQQLDQLPAFLKEEISRKEIAPSTADARGRAAAAMTPLWMRLRAAFFAFVDGSPAGAEAILIGARKPFAEWAALCQSTPFGKPAGEFTALLEETAGACEKKADPKRIQALVDVLNHGFEGLITAFQKNSPPEAGVVLKRVQRDWQRIQRQTDPDFFAVVPLSSLPKSMPTTVPAALAQWPALRDALDEVDQTLWTTGRVAPARESLDRFREVLSRWRKPLDPTSAGPLIAAMADSLDEAGKFLDLGDVVSAHLLITSVNGQTPASLAKLAAMPPDVPDAKWTPSAILRAELMTAQQCLLRSPKCAERLIRRSVRRGLELAANLEGTPCAAPAGLLVGQLETLQRFWEEGNARGAYQICAALSENGLRFARPSDADAQAKNSSALALEALAVWPAVAEGFDWAQSPDLAKSLLAPAMVQFEQWKTSCRGTPAQPASEAIWQLAAGIRGLLDQGEPEAARLLAEAFGQRLTNLETVLAGAKDPGGSQALAGEILEVYLRALKLALDPVDQAPDPQAARVLPYAAGQAREAFARSLAGNSALQSVLEDGWQNLSEALRQRDTAKARTLLDVISRQVRLSSEPPPRNPSPRFPSTSRKTSGLYEVSAEGDLMGNILANLSRNYAVRLCFEELELDPQKDGLTAEAVIKTLEAKAKLSASETDRLDSARRIRKDHGPKVLIDSGAPRLTAKIQADSLEQTLEQLTAGTRYAWRKIGATFVVLPRVGSVLNFPVTADVGGLTMQAAAERLVGQKPAGSPIGLSIVILGNFAPGKDPMSLLQTTVPPLSFRDQSALEALCALTESPTPTFAWQLAGSRFSRGLSIYALPDGPPQPGPTPPTPTGKETYVLEYEDTTMAELITRVRAAFPERLCFEQAPSEFLSAAETIRRLEDSARFVPQREADKKLLSAARQAAQDGGPFASSPHHSGSASGATFEEFLDRLTRETDYTWRKTAGAFVVFPLNGGLSRCPLTLKLPTGSVAENVRLTLAAVPPQTKTPPLVKTPGGVDLDAPVPPLELEAGTVAETLCRITENSAGVWNLSSPGNRTEVTILPHAKGR